jgi:acetyltransferase-like isoleucine patch superfamily enzyme
MHELAQRFLLDCGNTGRRGESNRVPCPAVAGAGDRPTGVPGTVIYPNTHLGPDSELGEYVVLGLAPRAHGLGELSLVIGAGAVIRSHSVIYAGNVIGLRFQTGHGVLIRESNEIDDDVSIGSHSIVEHHVRIEAGVRIHSNAFIPEFSVLERGAWIGPNVVLTNASYPLSPRAKQELRGPIIRAGAKVGANATLLPGVVIGPDALVGAGAVVVADVPGGTVVVGNPAKVIRQVSEIAAYQETTS